MTKIGKLLKKQREALGLTQKDVAEHLNWNTSQQVSNYERGACLPPADVIRDLSQFLKLSADAVWDCLEADLKKKFFERMKCTD